MVGMMTTPTKKNDRPNCSMNGSIAPTRISDRTASRAAAPSSTTIAIRPVQAGPPCSSASPAAPRVTSGWLNWKISDRP